MHWSSKKHHISKAVWETLIKCQFGDGEENRDDVFYTPLESPVKEDSSCNIVVNSSQTHLELHGYVHSKIVKQLLEIYFAPFERSPRIE